jgi:hypothetical protein
MAWRYDDASNNQLATVTSMPDIHLLKFIATWHVYKERKWLPPKTLA